MNTTGWKPVESVSFRPGQSGGAHGAGAVRGQPTGPGAAGYLRQAGRVRVVWVETATAGTLILAASLAPEELSGGLVARMYRRRWQIECFFRWVKCLLGCRHWLAESRAGVSHQLYLALIAAVLLQQALGRRPTRRMFELLQFHQLGLATTDELMEGLSREAARQDAAAQKRR